MLPPIVGLLASYLPSLRAICKGCGVTMPLSQSFCENEVTINVQHLVQFLVHPNGEGEQNMAPQMCLVGTRVIGRNCRYRRSLENRVAGKLALEVGGGESCYQSPLLHPRGVSAGQRLSTEPSRFSLKPRPLLPPSAHGTEAAVAWPPFLKYRLKIVVVFFGLLLICLLLLQRALSHRT